MNGCPLVKHIGSRRIGDYCVEILERTVGPTYEAAIFGTEFDDLAFKRSRAKFRADVVVVQCLDLPKLRDALPQLIANFERSLTYSVGSLEKLGHPLSRVELMQMMEASQ